MHNKRGFQFCVFNHVIICYKKIEFKRDSDIHIHDTSTYTPLRHIMTECLFINNNRRHKPMLCTECIYAHVHLFKFITITNAKY